MDEVRQRLTQARAEAVDRLKPLGLTPWIMPRGGFYLWCRLPDGHDSAVLARRCMEEKIVLAPGNVFSVSQAASSFMRFNVAQLNDRRIFQALKRAMESC